MSFCGHQAHVTKAKDEQLQQGRLRPGFDTRWSQEVAHLRDTVGARWIPKERRQGLEPDGARHWGPQEGCTSRKGGTCTQPAKRTLAAADGRKTRLGVLASKLPVPSHRAWLRLALAGVALGLHYMLVQRTPYLQTRIGSLGHPEQAKGQRLQSNVPLVRAPRSPTDKSLHHHRPTRKRGTVSESRETPQGTGADFLGRTT